MAIRTKLSSITTCVAMGLVLSTQVSAQVNLIENGSFETPDISKVIGKRGGTSSTWQYYDATNVDGFSGSNIEIWNSGFLGVDAVHGQQFIELNSHPTSNGAFSIVQEFETVVGQFYDLSFHYEARVNNKEEFNVSIDSVNTNSNLLDNNINDHAPGGVWNFFTGIFKADDTKTRLRFTSVTPTTRTVGNFIDDVRVTKSSRAVPEIDGGSTPLAIGLLLGIVSLIREKKQRSEHH